MNDTALLPILFLLVVPLSVPVSQTMVAAPNQSDLQAFLDCSGPRLVFAAPPAQQSCFPFTGYGLLQVNGTYGGGGETVPAGATANFVLYVYGSGTLSMYFTVVDVNTSQTVASGHPSSGVVIGGSGCASATAVNVAGSGPQDSASVSHGDVIALTIDFTFDQMTSTGTLCSGGSTASGFTAGQGQTTTASTSISTSTSPTSTTSPTTPSSSTLSSTTSTPTTSSPASGSPTTSTPGMSGGGAGFPILVIGLIAALVFLVALFGWYFFVRTVQAGPKPPPGGSSTVERVPPPPPPPKDPAQHDDNPPTIYGGALVTCCGPDVTANVLGCMIQLMKDYFSWPRDKQHEHLKLLIDPESFNSAWDISQLAPAGERGEKSKPNEGWKKTLKPYENKCMKPTSPCYPSVVFLDNCHHPQVVNYIMWGVLARLFDEFSERTGTNPLVEAIPMTEVDPDFHPTEYSETVLHGLHSARSTGTALTSAWEKKWKGTGPGYEDVDYIDDVATASVGWKLADDYCNRVKFGKRPYLLGEVNIPALKAILEAKQNRARRTAPCSTNCGPYMTKYPFSYTWGD